jgi:hypothetical protein
MLLDQWKPKDTELCLLLEFITLSFSSSVFGQQGKVVLMQVMKIWDGRGRGPLIHSLGMRWGEGKLHAPAALHLGKYFWYPIE